MQLLDIKIVRNLRTNCGQYYILLAAILVTWLFFLPVSDRPYISTEAIEWQELYENGFIPQDVCCDIQKFTENVWLLRVTAMTKTYSEQLVLLVEMIYD